MEDKNHLIRAPTRTKSEQEQDIGQVNNQQKRKETELTWGDAGLTKAAFPDR